MIVSFIIGLFIGGVVGIFGLAILKDRIVDDEVDEDGEKGQQDM